IENGITISNPGSFQGGVSSVLATVISLESSCESLPVSVNLETVPALLVEWKDFIPVCADPAGNFVTPVSLGVDLGEEYIYTWSLSNDPDGDGVQNPVLIIDEHPPDGIINLEILDIITGCSYSFTAQIERFSPPVDIGVEITGNDFESNGYVVRTQVIDNNDNAVYEYRLNN